MGAPAGGQLGSVYLRTMEVFPTQDSPAITIFTSSGGLPTPPSPCPCLGAAMEGAECRPGRAGPWQARAGRSGGHRPPRRGQQRPAPPAAWGGPAAGPGRSPGREAICCRCPAQLGLAAPSPGRGCGARAVHGAFGEQST